MIISELVKQLEAAKKQFGDNEVFVDCSLEALSSSASGVYLNAKSGIVHIGDKGFQEEILDYLVEYPDDTDIILLKEL